MSSTLGKYLEISVFGESHGKAIGVTVNGLPVGYVLDDRLINRYLSRRATGKNILSSSRKEKDKVEILSGLYNGKTTGAPLTMIICNSDCRSSDYSDMERLARPSHADYSGFVRYKGFNDIRGGGHFSGRLTTPIVMAGAVAIGILSEMGIEICGNIIQIGNEKGAKFDGSTLNKEVFDNIKESDFPSLSGKEKFGQLIEEARQNQDSIGGYIECAVIGMKAGIGSPMFDGIENNIAKAVFGIPAVKGIEFGEDCDSLYGSLYNDKLRADGGKIVTITNHDGGINGGISNGMPILFKVKMKPTPSIALEQQTVNFRDKINENIAIKGRHDPCIVVRATPCIECITALAILDCVMESKIYE